MTDNEKKDDVTLKVQKPSIGGDDKTAKIPKLNKPGTPGGQKVVMNAASNSAIKPSDVTRISSAVPPGAEETIQMDKSDVKDVPEIAGFKQAADDSTQKTLKPPPPISKTAKSKTIKLKPLKPINATEDNQEETLSMDRQALLDEEMPSLGAPSQTPGLNDEATIKIKKPTANKPSHPTPSIPGSKETIKLRPSNATPAPTKSEDTMATVSMSKKTIRLIPKQPGATDDSTQKTTKPSAPTVKLGAPPPAAPAPAGIPAAVAPPPAPAAPSAPTVKMPEPAAAPPPAAPTGGKKTLKLKATPKAPATAPAPPPTATGSASTETDVAAQAKKGKAKKEKVQGADPGVGMTLVAVFTLILMAYYTWMTIGSWAEGEQDVTKNASVPLLSQTVQPSR